MNSTFRNEHVAAPLKAAGAMSDQPTASIPQRTCCGPIEGLVLRLVSLSVVHHSATNMLRPH